MERPVREIQLLVLDSGAHSGEVTSGLLPAGFRQQVFTGHLNFQVGETVNADDHFQIADVAEGIRCV